MFKIGDHVVHPGQGVCTVMGFKNDTPQPMILLEAKSGHSKTVMMYPVSQADRLHATITREDAENILDNYADIKCDDFTERNSSLEESHFKQELKKGAPTTVIVAKTMIDRIHRAEAADRNTRSGGRGASRARGSRGTTPGGAPGSEDAGMSSERPVGNRSAVNPRFPGRG